MLKYLKKLLKLEIWSPNFAKPDTEMPCKVFAHTLLGKNLFSSNINA